MKNTVNKGLFFYLLTFLGVIVGVACIFAAILILSPGTELFGVKYCYVDDLRYVDENPNGEPKKLDTIQYTRNDSGHTVYFQDLINGKKVEINIETGYSNVYVEQNLDVVNFGIKIEGRITGISKAGDESDYKVTSDYDLNTNVYNFKIKEPVLVVPFSNSVTIHVQLPEKIDMSKVDLHITTKTGNVRIGHETQKLYNLNSLEINSTEKSDITIKNAITINNGTTIISPKGTIILETEKPETTSAIAGGKLFIKSTSAKIVMDTVTPDSLSIVSESSSIKIKNVKSNFDYDAYKGVLIVDGEITGNFSCSERVNISNIQIDRVTGDVLLPVANTSNITVNYIGKDCLINTTSGNVKIGEMKGSANVTTERGNVEINFNHKETAFDRYASRVTTKTGKITLRYSNITKENVISTESGEVAIYFPATSNFTLIYDCQTNKPTSSKGITIENKSGTQNIGSGSSSDILQITNTKGKTYFDDQYTA